MKKQIRLLVENIFNDIYDIDQENNSSVEIADEIFKYKIGDIYYENKKPYAICCGDSDSFKDNNPRFIPYWLNMFYDEFSCATNFTDKHKLLKFQADYPYFYLTDKLKSIDENGYENTQELFNKFASNNLDSYPLLKECAKLGNEFYIPSIDELQVLLLNLKNISKNTEIDIYKEIMYIEWFIYSSTPYIDYCMCAVYIYNFYNEIYIVAENPFKRGYIIPFIKI